MNPTILGIDPGTEESGWMVYQSLPRRIIDMAIEPNPALLYRIRHGQFNQVDYCVLEKVQCYGMPVGEDVFQTVFMCGRFVEALSSKGVKCKRMARRQVKLYLCDDMRAKDKNIRQALIDRFGGPARAIGRKAAPGPLHGVSKHLWAALALVVTETEEPKKEAKNGRS